MAITDAELVAASRHGDAGAFGQIVERYQRAVCAVSYSGTGDRTLSEDIAQDTFVTAWRQLAGLREIERLPAWLCGIARNLARSARRRRGREVALEDREIVADLTAFDAISERETESVINAALSKLPETYREPMVLFYCEQQSVAAVARALGISEDATHQRLSRGRQQLAAGVTGLVERTLEGRKPRRDLAAAVVAAIAGLGVIGLGGSRVEASTTKGTSMMMKAGIAAAIAVAIGGAGYVATRSHAEPVTDASTAKTAAIAGTPIAGQASTPPAWMQHMHHGGGGGGGGGAAISAGAAPSLPTPSCDAIAQHIADLAVEAQPDAATMTPDLIATTAKPIYDHVIQACTQMHWSEQYLACVGAAGSMFDIAVGCKGSEPPMMHHQAPQADDKFVSIEESTTPIAPYAGTDDSCGSVARHLVLFSMPDHSAIEKLPEGKRPAIAAAIANMQKTLPDQIDASCEQGSWTEAKRRCMLASTTRDASQKCL